MTGLAQLNTSHKEAEPRQTPLYVKMRCNMKEIDAKMYLDWRIVQRDGNKG